MKQITFTALALLIAGASPLAFAHGDENHAKRAGPVKMEQKPWGIAGNAPGATRTITASMLDKMRFSVDKIEVKQGDTVRFVLKNDGNIMHEFVIGTKATLDEHAAAMTKFPNMEHDEPYMAHVPAGKTGELVWTFNKPGSFDFACLIAGHYQNGMIGKITVASAK